MKHLRNILILLIALAMLLSLAPAASAEDADGDARFAGRTWQEIMEEFLAEHHAAPESVACGWCNTVTGEEQYWNGDQYMVSGSMYKVPMNMIFTEMVHNGEIGWNTFIGGYRYEYCLHATIVDSNNDVAKGMWDYLGGYQPYRHLLAPYMGEDPDTVDEKFYENNFSTPRQMIYSLKLLTTEPERFPRLIDEMLQAEPNKYFKEREHDYDIAQKYGYWPDPNGWHVALNDCAVIFTEEPVCIVIFIDSVSEQSSRLLLKDYCDLMIEYTEYSTAARREAERIAARQAVLQIISAEQIADEKLRLSRNAIHQAAVERIYDSFVSLVAEGRNLTYDFVDGIAQGRVWTGRDAIAIHLVDEIGTLEDAIKWAAEAAGESLEEADLKHWQVVGYPKPPTAMESVLEMLGNKPSGDEIFSGSVLEPAAKALMNWTETLREGGRSVMVARMPYEIVWAD